MTQNSSQDTSQDTGTTAPGGQKQLHSAVIARQLENEIIAGELKAGSRLDEIALAERFGVSRTPVREALHILASRHLAERVPYRGVIVATITRERIDQLFEAMGEIEATCGRFAAERMSMSERAALETLHLDMVEMAETSFYEAYEDGNTRFHTLIFEGTHNDELIQIAHGLRLKLAPFRRSQLRAAERMKKSNEEHALIVNAIIERNAKEAERALRRHLVSAARAVLEHMT